MKIPCPHAIKANKELKYKTNVFEWYEYAFDSIYMLSSYKAAYTGIDLEPPILQELIPDMADNDNDSIETKRLAPPRYKTKGRPKKKGMRKRTETLDGRPVKTYKCSLCGATDHNVTQCENLYYST